MAPLTGKVAFVTGGSQGIGRAVAERLGRDGASVLVGYLANQSGAEEAVAAITQSGARATPCRVDITKAADVRAFYEAGIAALGRPDVVVNNAGVGTLMELADSTEEEYDRVFDVNARGTFLSLREAARAINDGGRIVNISSSTTLFPIKGTAIYAGSKMAIKAYTEAAALELGERGVTVNTVMPGVTNTPMTARLPAEFKAGVIANTPSKRMGQPEDLADAVAFLASADSHWITGQHILVNGGAKN